MSNLHATDAHRFARSRSSPFPEVYQIGCRADLPGLALDVELALPGHWTVLFGPSGSGKSTLLRSVAGLGLRCNVQRLRAGAFEDISHLPPEARNIGYVPQGALLFPHLSVESNLRFGASGGGQAGALQEVAALCEVTHLLHRQPPTLSGGEAMRVALARGLLRSPDLLLLDEPLAALDRPLRRRIAAKLRAWCRDHAITVLSVTHDVEETFLLEADVAVLEGGRIVRQGPVAEVLAAERSELIGNLA